MKDFISGILIFFSVAAFAQERYYSEPLKIPILLTGSFAELRANHFHSGIDIRTEGRTGLPVYSTADGFVSRIAVSPYGFGNALYIGHPNGTTSVYGHLGRFNPAISEYVKNIQYQNENFNVDQTVPHGLLPVPKNEIIAYSGNSGSSGGPHLHFEIRDTRTEETLNPLQFHLNVRDTICPKITGLRIYPLDQNSAVNYSKGKKGFETVFYGGKYHIKNNQVASVSGKIGFGIQATDYLNGTLGKCGINFLSLKVDGIEVFSFQIEKFAFADTRYINSLIDFEGYMTDQRRFYKTWKEPGNKLEFYRNLVGDGAFIANDLNQHKVEIEVKDAYQNTSVVEFLIKGVPPIINDNLRKGFQAFYYNQANSFEAEGVSLSCPEGSFYTDFDFTYQVVSNSCNPVFYSDIHQIHLPTTPIHNSIKLSIKPNNLPEKLQDKALLVSIDKKSGIRTYAGGEYNDGFISAGIRAFGSFAVAVDTIAPSISPLSIKDKKTLLEPARLRFKISDNLSGIKKYSGAIDGKWVLFEYDAKNNLITYKFDKTRMESNKSHNLILVVSDNKGNDTTYEATFFK